MRIQAPLLTGNKINTNANLPKENLPKENLPKEHLIKRVSINPKLNEDESQNYKGNPEYQNQIQTHTPAQKKLNTRNNSMISAPNQIKSILAERNKVSTNEEISNLEAQRKLLILQTSF